MDTIKIGKFIAENRKNKKMTQEQLAEKLGVTSKTISRWENGNYMPDISLLKPISEELGVTLNDLLSGEKVEKEHYQEKFEENMINTIDYTSKKIYEKNRAIGLLLIVFGVICSISAMTIFPSDSSWGSIYSIIGAIISLVGVSRFTKVLSLGKRLACNFAYFILFIALLFIIDYIGVVNIHQAPRFAKEKVTVTDMIYYDTPFYDVIRHYPDEENEYYEVVKNQKHDIDTLYNMIESENESQNKNTTE